MKNNKILYKSLAALMFAGMTLGTVGCSEDYVKDVVNSGTFDDSNYFKTEDQCTSATAAVYDIMKKYAGGFENMVTFFNSGSDDFYSGGGSSTDGLGIQGMNNYSINANTMPASYWKDYYQGVSRANWVIKRLPEAPVDDAFKQRLLAEVTVLRSLYYFELVRMFGNIPLILEPIDASVDYWNIPQVEPQQIYNQIEADILSVIDQLPMTVNGADRGRITQGSARAILGKIYLFDKKNDLAAEQLALVNGTPGSTSQYGYKLVDNYASLFEIDNKFTSEAVLEANYTNKGNSDWGFWGYGNDEGNSICIMIGPRSYTRASSAGSDVPDLVSGWSFNTVTEDLYNTLKDDPRFDATILDAGKLAAEGKITYSPGYADTGYFLKKYAPLREGQSQLPGAMELNFRQNYIAIRLADTYLMEAEALGGTGARAQALLDAVRDRVGLPSIPVNMQNIKEERRRELAGEGHRWFDLVRWGDAPSKLASKGFVSGKNEILPIPFTELPNTALVQNPNY